jgi:hypothetical protein
MCVIGHWLTFDAESSLPRQPIQQADSGIGQRKSHGPPIYSSDTNSMPVAFLNAIPWNGETSRITIILDSGCKDSLACDITCIEDNIP